MSLRYVMHVDAKTPLMVDPRIHHIHKSPSLEEDQCLGGHIFVCHPGKKKEKIFIHVTPKKKEMEKYVLPKGP